MFVGTKSGIFKSTNAGADWTNVSNGVVTGDVRAVALGINTVFAGNNQGVFRSDDAGATWSANLRSGEIGGLSVNGTTIYAAIRSTPGLAKSTDNGATWIDLSDKDGRLRDIRTVISFGDTVLAGTSGNSVVVSFDAGNNWQPFNQGPLDENEDIRTLAKSGRFVYLTTNANGIYRSSNGGISWTQVNGGLSNTTSRGLAVNGSTVYTGFNGGGVWQLINHGSTWQTLNDGNIETFDIRTLSAGFGLLYAGANDGKVFRNQIPNVALKNKLEVQTNLFPNPSNGFLHVKFSAAVSVEQMHLYDAKGTKISMPAKSSWKSQEFEVETSHLQNGLYHLCLDTAEGQITLQFSKE